jgi:NADH:ubiquinone oxidoreductase subunit E
MVVDKEVYGRMNPSKAKDILADYREKETR